MIAGTIVSDSRRYTSQACRFFEQFNNKHVTSKQELAGPTFLLISSTVLPVT
jgi:hypothetical protein